MVVHHRNILSDTHPVVRLRVYVTLFFVAVMVPLSAIVFYGFEQFEKEMFFQYRWKSSNALQQINTALVERVTAENERPASHYSFYRKVDNPVEMGWSREVSPLANPDMYPKDIGLLGYFQINVDGQLETPLLPHQTKQAIAAADIEMQWDEVERRLQVRRELGKVLRHAGLLFTDDTEAVTGGADEWQPQKMQDTGKHGSGMLAEQQQRIDPVRLVYADATNLVFYRNVWIDNRRMVQGFVADRREYLHPLMLRFIDLAYYDNRVQAQFSDRAMDGRASQYFIYKIDRKGISSVEDRQERVVELERQLIYQGTLVTPFSSMSLRFTTDYFPSGPASKFVIFFLVVLLIIIFAGCIGFYWLGLRQISLAEQRMNFVSSISHELKTPLTSISMYSEMLKSGMVQDADKQSEYHSFIFSESGRLSRLINNILRLSSVSQRENSVQPEFVDVRLLQDTMKSKLSSMIDENQFELRFLADKKEKLTLEAYVDVDAFTQIAINLVDNAIKFFKAAKIDDEKRRYIDVSFKVDGQSPDRLIFSVRDYGAGISKDQSQKIFELFYRGGSEMTRTTSGTGIGLALVKELVTAQDGAIQVRRLDVGVSFDLSFRCRQVTS